MESKRAVVHVCQLWLSYELEDPWDSETPSQSNYGASANPRCQFAWEPVRDSKRLYVMHSHTKSTLFYDLNLCIKFCNQVLPHLDCVTVPISLFKCSVWMLTFQVLTKMWHYSLLSILLIQS